MGENEMSEHRFSQEIMESRKQLNKNFSALRKKKKKELYGVIA